MVCSGEDRCVGIDASRFCPRVEIVVNVTEFTLCPMCILRRLYNCVNSCVSLAGTYYVFHVLSGCFGRRIGILQETNGKISEATGWGWKEICPCPCTNEIERPV